MFEDGSFIVVVFMAIFTAGLIVFRVLEVRTRPPEVGTRDYWIQQEIDQTMAWWDREFNRLSGTGEFAAVAEYKQKQVSHYAECPSCGGEAVAGTSPTLFTCKSCGAHHRRGAKKGLLNGAKPIYTPTEWRDTPTYELAQVHKDEYVMDPIAMAYSNDDLKGALLG